MKRKLIFGAMLICLLVLGLTLIGCPTDSDDDGGGGGSPSPGDYTVEYDKGVNLPALEFEFIGETAKSVAVDLPDDNIIITPAASFIKGSWSYWEYSSGGKVEVGGTLTPEYGTTPIPGTIKVRIEFEGIDPSEHEVIITN
jgi:hypothetical protein